MGSLTYVGHSTVLVEQGGLRTAHRPPVAGGDHAVRRRVPMPELDTLRDLDAVLISHAHADHLDLGVAAPARPFRPGRRPRGVGAIVRKAGMRDVIELDVGERWEGVEAVAADHDGRRHPLGKHMPALGFLLDGPVRVYFAGDTDLFDDMETLAGRSTWRCCRSGAGGRASRPDT